MSYEFSADHNKTMISVSTLALVLASLFIIGGIAGFIDALVDVRGDKLGTYAIVQLIQGILQFGIGVLIIPAVLSFRNVATTEGSDIKNLMEGLKKMGKTFYLLALMLMITIVLGIVGIFGTEELL